MVRRVQLRRRHLQNAVLQARHSRSRRRHRCRSPRRSFFNRIIRDRSRGALEHVAVQVLRLHNTCARRCEVGEVRSTQRRHARARNLDHDFGRVDEHRGITGRKIGRHGELRGAEDDREDIV